MVLWQQGFTAAAQHCELTHILGRSRWLAVQVSPSPPAASWVAVVAQTAQRNCMEKYTLIAELIF